MRLMGNLIQCRNISQIEKCAALAAKVFCLRKVSESFLADLRSLEKVINKVDDSSISLIHIESTELETTAMDEITNKNTTEEEMMIHGGSFSVHGENTFRVFPFRQFQTKQRPAINISFQNFSNI